MMLASRRGEVPAGVVDVLERGVLQLARRKGVRHAIVGVERGDQAFRWIGAAGVADAAGTPMTPDTPYMIASVTKLYIGAAVLRLHEQGRLDIDRALATYLPAELIGGLHRRNGVDRTSELTLRHLLAHASGLPDCLIEAPRGSKALLDRVLEEGDRAWSIAEAIAVVRALPQAHFNPRPFDGRRHTVRYSDTNFQLLIAVIEVVAQRPVHEAFADLLYARLRLERTWHPGTPPESGMPRAAVPWAGDQPLDIPLAMRSFRDLFSTAAETLRFLRALVTGELFDNAATGALMRQHFNPLAFSFIPRSPGWPIEYGLAMMRFRAPRILAPLVRIPLLIGHSGVTGSWLFYAPDFDLYVTGTVDQLAAPAVPFRQVPRLVRQVGAAQQG